MKKAISLIFSILIIYSAQAQTIDTLVDVGGYKLHFRVVKGKGVPIVFESGNGDDSTVWKDLLKPLHDSTQATLITYDRAGLGLSEIDTNKINIQNEVTALETGLKKLGYFKNFFVVSHSFGSYYSTLFALKNPKKVKGVVFIDVLTPCYFTKSRARETKESISKDDWQMLKKEAIGLYHVLDNLESIYDYTKDKQLPPSIPLTVIGADIPPPIVKENKKEEWKNCLRAFGELPNHSYVLAKNSGHKVWKNDPSLVIGEIVKLYRKVK
ncbi:MAG: alpha/beta fold hydrolase [Spirosomataceae bacterium]